MMKKLAGLLLMLLLMVTSTAFMSYAENDAIGLRLDGKEILSDSPAVIIADRTLVPARAVFEAMGGIVSWDDPSREVTVTLGTTVVKLKIDLKTASVNGVPQEMDVAAMIISERTMIPVRFVSEALGYSVAWDDPTRVVSITTPESNQENLIITGIHFEETDSAYKIIVSANQAVMNYKSFTLPSPDRYVLDIDGGTLGQVTSPTVPENAVIKGIRFSQFDPTTIRIVADLTKQAAASINASGDQKNLSLVFPKSGEAAGEDSAVLPELNPLASGKLVIIDAGHGGKDPGAIGFVDGKPILFEKDVNLDVALRIEKLLKEKGVSTSLIRSLDTSVNLLERPIIANAAAASLFISIHNNSSESPLISGFEVLFYNKASESNYAINSGTFADLARGALQEEFGSAYKLPQERPSLAVLNKTLMPAIIIEGAYMSNPMDLALIMTDAYKEKYALAAARAIILTLNKVVNP